MLYQIQRQRTAGAYITIKTVKTHEEAVAYLAKIARDNPLRPYNGENKWQDSNDVHCVNRYRIAELQIQ